MAVIGDGLSISQVAEKVGVSRQTLHSWLARYEAEGRLRLIESNHDSTSGLNRIKRSNVCAQQNTSTLVFWRPVLSPSLRHAMLAAQHENDPGVLKPLAARDSNLR
jgi:hypothetical protein